MMESQKLIDEIKGNIQPDYVNGRYSQIKSLGDGSAIELEIGELLYSLIRATKPGVVVETGTNKGFSGLMIADALRANGHGHLYTIDHLDFGASERFKNFSLDHLTTLMHMNSVAALGELAKTLAGKVDFLWLDADHATKAVLAELDAALPLLAPKAYIAFHDTTLFKTEHDAICQIRQRFPSWEYVRIISARGFDLMRTA
jgi:predicted O-methyltransferase YrrM